MKGTTRIAGLLLLLVAAVPAGAQSAIPGLFNTAVDDSRNVLPVGSTDPHYTVLENAGAQAVVTDNGAYAHVPSAGYIWQTAAGQPGSVTRTFRTTFDLTGFDVATAFISGRWSTDNVGLDILINGMSTGSTSFSFTSYTPFSIVTGFVNGVNTLDFVVQDQSPPGALSVDQLSGSAFAANGTVVPEPASLALLATGLVGLLGGVARGRRKTTGGIAP